MNYQELYDLHQSPTSPGLKARAQFALAKYCAYTIGLNANADDVAWAKSTLRDIAGKIELMFWEFINDPAIRDSTDLSAVTDSQVQTIVETICRKY